MTSYLTFWKKDSFSKNVRIYIFASDNILLCFQTIFLHGGKTRRKIVPKFFCFKVIFNVKLTLFAKNHHEARLEAKPISGGQTGGQRARPICRRPGCFPGGQIFGIWPPGGQTGNPGKKPEIARKSGILTPSLRQYCVPNRLSVAYG